MHAGPFCQLENDLIPTWILMVINPNQKLLFYVQLFKKETSLWEPLFPVHTHCVVGAFPQKINTMLSVCVHP